MEDSDGSSTRRGLAPQIDAMKFEMVLPALMARMEQFCYDILFGDQCLSDSFPCEDCNLHRPKPDYPDHLRLHVLWAKYVQREEPPGANQLAPSGSTHNDGRRAAERGLSCPHSRAMNSRAVELVFAGRR